MDDDAWIEEAIARELDAIGDDPEENNNNEDGDLDQPDLAYGEDGGHTKEAAEVGFKHAAI